MSFRSCEFTLSVCRSSVSRSVSVTRAENRAGFVSRSQMKVVILCDLTEELWDTLEVFVTVSIIRRAERCGSRGRQKPAIMSRTKEHSRLFPVSDSEEKHGKYVDMNIL